MAPTTGRSDHLDVVTSLAVVLFLLQIDRGGGFSMLSRNQFEVLNAGDSVALECEFHTKLFNLFDNPVLWIKTQRHEKQRINIMGNINAPFMQTGRFKVTFYPSPPRYRLVLEIARLSLEDSGNYTCEVRGPDTTYLGHTEHSLFIRAPVTDITLNKNNCSGARDHRAHACAFTTPDSLTFTANDPASLQCVASGGNPPPEIEIFLGDVDITYQFQTEQYTTLLGEPGLQIMSSSVHTRNSNFVLSAEDDRKTLHCRATVSGLDPNTTRTVVHVRYAPVITCETTYARLDRRNVYVSCVVKARPRTDEIFWFVDNDLGTVVTQGKMEGEYWSLDQDRADGNIETKLFMGRARPEYYKSYKVMAENIVGKTAAYVELKLSSEPEEEEHEPYYREIGDERSDSRVDYIFVPVGGRSGSARHLASYATVILIAFRLLVSLSSSS